MEDLKAAGLNPVLSASGGNGAAIGSGATAAGVQGMSGAKADADQSGNAALASLYGALINAQTQMYNSNLAAKTNMYVADRQVEASMYGAQLAANANMYGSQMAYNASVYGADQNLLNNREQRQHSIDHPTTVPGMVTSSNVNRAMDYIKDGITSLFKGTPSAKSKSTYNGYQSNSGRF